MSSRQQAQQQTTVENRKESKESNIDKIMASTSESTSEVIAEDEASAEYTDGFDTDAVQPNVELQQTAAEAEDSSMALIMKRYEAKTQNTSPSNKRRTGGPGSAKTASLTETTPKGGRKWQKKVRKNNSCPVGPSGAPPNPSTSSGAALGLNLRDCATGVDGDDSVPLLVRLCAQVVETHGMQTVGVYRVPGNTANVNALMAQLDGGFENIDFTDPRWKDVNVVSSLLKAFFRKLPEPLLTDKLYPIFIDANRIAKHDKRVTKIRYLVRKLPKQNQDTLRFLITHLSKIVMHAHENKMEPRNLALMFGPSIVRPSSDSDNMQTMVTHMSDQCKLIESMLIYCDWIFYSDMDDTSPPPEIPAAGNEDTMIQSFSDMTDLLRRQEEEKEAAAEQKRSGIFGGVGGRRGSRKGASSSGAAGNGGTSNGHQSAARTSSGRNLVIGDPQQQRRTQSDRSVVAPQTTQHDLINGPYQERDIDAEIAMRQTTQCETSPTAPDSSRLDPGSDGHNLLASGARSVPSHSPVHQRQSNSGSNEVQALYADMRRKREQNLYMARRVFINGPDANGTAPNITFAGSYPGPGTSALEPPRVPMDYNDHSPASTGNESAMSTSSHGGTGLGLGSDPQLDRLVQHTKYLNVSGCSERAFDVLSPETREKIRRLHQEGQLQHEHTDSGRPKLRQIHLHRHTDGSGMRSDFGTGESTIHDQLMSSSRTDTSMSDDSPKQTSGAPRLLQFGVTVNHGPPPPTHQGQRTIDRTWYEDTPSNQDVVSEPYPTTTTTTESVMYRSTTSTCDTAPLSGSANTVDSVGLSDEVDSGTGTGAVATSSATPDNLMVSDNTSETSSQHSSKRLPPTLRLLNATEKTRARISQKIRFRSNKQSSREGSIERQLSEETTTPVASEQTDSSASTIKATTTSALPNPSTKMSRLFRLHRKRSDPRRHTLSDIEQIKQAIEMEDKKTESNDDDQTTATTTTATETTDETKPTVVKHHHYIQHKHAAGKHHESRHAASRLASWLKMHVMGKSSPDLTVVVEDNGAQQQTQPGTQDNVNTKDTD